MAGVLAFDLRRVCHTGVTPGRRQAAAHLKGLMEAETGVNLVFNGEGGIRTLDERITTRNALAGRRLQPLGHLSGVAQDIGRPARFT